MRKHWSTATLGMALLASIAATAQTPSPAVMPVNAPSLKVGDRWKYVYLDGLTKLEEGQREEKVTAISPEAILTEVKNAAGRETAPGRYDAQWNFLVDVGGQAGKEMRFSFPLEAGKTWEATWPWMNSQGHVGRMEMTYKVRGGETVTARAGTFEAIVIEGRGHWYNTTRGSSGPAHEMLWYAPAAKRFVRRSWVTRFSGGQLDQNRITEAVEVDIKP